jgi:hypothetical protein
MISTISSGRSGGFADFPNEATGWQALYSQIQFIFRRQADGVETIPFEPTALSESPDSSRKHVANTKENL